MPNRIVYTRSDGGVSIIVPARKFLNRFPTAEVALAAVQARSVPSDATDVQVINTDNVPADRTFRNAWRQMGGVFSTDMSLARGIHAEHITRAQAAEIARLKVEERSERLKGNTTQADAHAATVTALEALNLNTLATQIAAVSTPTALKAVWPAKVPR